jgi:hypothetical protein
VDNNSLCGNCMFWKPPSSTTTWTTSASQEGQGQTMGQCRRHGPKPFMAMAQPPGVGRIQQAGGPQAVSVQPIFLSAWPPVPADGWCGEWIILDKPAADA